jgi:hypothetical protein
MSCGGPQEKSFQRQWSVIAPSQTCSLSSNEEISLITQQGSFPKFRKYIANRHDVSSHGSLLYLQTRRPARQAGGRASLAELSCAFEILAVNNNSPDNTWPYLQNYKISPARHCAL